MLLVVYSFSETHFAFQFPHRKRFLVVRCASDRTNQFCSTGLFIFDLLCVYNCHLDVGSRITASQHRISTVCLKKSDLVQKNHYLTENLHNINCWN